MIEYKDPRVWAVAALRDDPITGAWQVSGSRGDPDNTGYPRIWVSMDGGPELHLRERLFLRVNVYHERSDTALAMSRQVEAVLRDSVDGNPVVRLSRSTGPNLIPDETVYDCYTLFDITCRAYEVGERKEIK